MIKKCYSLTILLLTILMSTPMIASNTNKETAKETADSSKFHKVRKSISAVVSAGFLGLTTGFCTKQIARHIVSPLVNIINHYNESGRHTYLLEDPLLSPLLYTIFFVAWKCNEKKLITAFTHELEACDIHLNAELIEQIWNLTSAASFILS